MQRSFISQWVGYMAVLEFRTKLEVSGDQSHARADRERGLTGAGTAGSDYRVRFILTLVHRAPFQRGGAWVGLPLSA